MTITTRRKTESSVRTVKFFVKGAPDLTENDNWKREARTFTPESVRVIDRTTLKGERTREVRVTGHWTGDSGTPWTVDSNWTDRKNPGSWGHLSEMPQWLVDVIAVEVSA